MTSILVMLPVAGPRVQYILSCPVAEQWLYLARWLTLKSIGFCTTDEHQNPDSLRANQLYCVVKGGDVRDAYLVFQVLQTPDWDDKERPAPQFTYDVGSLAYVLIEEQPVLDSTKLSDEDIEKILEYTDETKNVPLL